MSHKYDNKCNNTEYTDIRGKFNIDIIRKQIKILEQELKHYFMMELLHRDLSKLYIKSKGDAFNKRSSGHIKIAEKYNGMYLATKETLNIMSTLDPLPKEIINEEK